MKYLDYIFPIMGIFILAFMVGQELYWMITNNWPPDFGSVLITGVLAGVISLALAGSGRARVKAKERGGYAMLFSGLLILSFTIVTVWSGNSYLSGCANRIGPGAILKSCDFGGMDLHLSNLSDADLANATLSGTNLQQANLSGANLTNVSLIGADLTDAKLDKITLDNAILQDVKGLTDEILASALGVSIDDLPLITSQRRIRLESRDYIAENLAKVCDGEGVIVTSDYTADDSFAPYFPFVRYPQVSVEEIKHYHYRDPYESGHVAETMALRFTELVGCIEVHTEVIETCNYSAHGLQVESTKVFIRRVQVYSEFTLREAQTGEIVSAQTFTGSLPTECPGTFPPLPEEDWVETQDAGTPGYMIFGVPPDYQFWPWLEEYLNSPGP